MSSGRITRFVEDRARITAHAEAGVLEPEPIHAGWSTFVAHRSVRAIAVAPGSSHMWLATWGGVISWNRKQELLYRRYSSEHGLAGNATACICVDQAEWPWAGHVEGGLSYFDGHRWQIYGDLQSEPIRAVCRGPGEHGIWAAGAGAVYRIDAADRPATPVAIGDDGAVHASALLADGDGLLLGNLWGLFRLRPGARPERLSPDRIQACTALARGADGALWIGTPEAVYRDDGQQLAGPVGPAESDPSGRVVGLAAGRSRTWVLTTAGLAQIQRDSWVAVPAPDQAPAPQALAASADDSYLWVGTDRLLAGVWSPSPDQTRWDLDLLPAHREDALNNLGRCVAAHDDRGQIWVGTAGGLVTFDHDGAWSADAESGDIRALCQVSASAAAGPEAHSALWALSWPHGVIPLNAAAQADALVPPPGAVTALAAGEDQSLYALTGRGLWRLGAGEPALVAPSGPAAARCLAQLPDQTWWLGTTRGAYQLRDGRWALAGEQPGPLQAEVHALAVIGGELWAATAEGLWSRRAGAWLARNPAAPATPPAVYALAPAIARPGIWLAREDGVARYDPATGAAGEPYTPINSGMPSRRAHALVERDGILWIVTRAGIGHLKLP